MQCRRGPGRPSPLPGAPPWAGATLTGGPSPTPAKSLITLVSRVENKSC